MKLLECWHDLADRFPGDLRQGKCESRTYRAGNMEGRQARKGTEKVEPIGTRVLFGVVPKRKIRIILYLEVCHVGQGVLGFQPEADLGHERENRVIDLIREMHSKYSCQRDSGEMVGALYVIPRKANTSRKTARGCQCLSMPVTK